MDDYISRKAAVDEMKSWEQEDQSYHPEDYEDEEQEKPGIPVLEAIVRLNSIPPADVRPVVRGHWITEEEAIQMGDILKKDTCSVCGACDWDCIESKDFNFCPNCGAVMRPESPDREVGA